MINTAEQLKEEIRRARDYDEASKGTAMQISRRDLNMWIGNARRQLMRNNPAEYEKWEESK